MCINVQMCVYCILISIIIYINVTYNKFLYILYYLSIIVINIQRREKEGRRRREKEKKFVYLCCVVRVNVNPSVNVQLTERILRDFPSIRSHE